MKAVVADPSKYVAMWIPILHPNGAIPREQARKILELQLPDDVLARVKELTAKAKVKALTGKEDEEMEYLERMGAGLSVLKSKARQALKKAVAAG